MSVIANVAAKVGDGIANAAVLSPEQVGVIQARRENYFEELKSHDPNDAAAVEYTNGLLAASSVEIFNAHLSQIDKLYRPIVKSYGLKQDFLPEHNIRFLRIDRWVNDKEENTLEKLINVYDVLSDEECNIALVFHRTQAQTKVYLAVTNNKNDKYSDIADSLIQRLHGAVKGNFPGAELEEGDGELPCFDKYINYSVASASNIPTEKSEKFNSQTIEKLLDGIVPQNSKEEYTLILLATPVQDVEAKKMRLAELYSGMAPYASWQTNFTYTESDAVSSNAQLGVNVGASAGLQNGVNQSTTRSVGTQQSTSTSETNTNGTTITDAEGNTITDTSGETLTTGSSSGSSRAFSEGTSASSTEGYGYNQSHSTTEGSSKSVGGGSTTTGTIGSTTTVGVNSTTTVGVQSNTSVSANAGGGIPGVFSGGGSVGHSFGTSASQSVGVSASEAVNVSASEAINVNFNNTTSNSATDQFGTSSNYSTMTGINSSLTNTTNTSTSQSAAQTLSRAIGQTAQRSIAKNTAQAIANTLGRAVTNTMGSSLGEFKGINLGANFGVNFARSSNVTATVGKNEGITQTFTNYNIRHTLEILETQMKRYEQSAALGMWDFAAYVLSEDFNIASNVAHLYVALTQGEESFTSKAAINVWRGDMSEEKEESADAKEICDYLRELRHPNFALDPKVTYEYPDYNIYPPIIQATACLSGKELAYSLNFPKKSIAGLPVIECAEFGRNIVTYDDNDKDQKKLRIGQIFHMNHPENTTVCLSKNSLASHTFITGSTGSGKSNTVYQILNEAMEYDVKFLVVEPAKGEYKHVFGNLENVKVYGTNPSVTPLLKIDPFSFPREIHVLEHLDRLVEIFNVCWPMYAAMPAVLKNALEKSYEDCGWDLTESTNEFGDDFYPNFADVAKNVKLIIDSSEYDNENKGAYKGALLTRLNSLTNGINGLIFTNDELSVKELFDENVIVDLSRVGSAETKSLIMGMLVLKLQEYRMTSGRMNAELNHITVLEEAHNLLKRTSTEQPVEGGNLLGKSVEMIANAIAEMRTYGEGFIIADQAPGLLDMSTIRNTNTKIIMRLPDQADRELVGKAANLNENQIAELAKLPCGVGAVYQNEWVQPVLCKVKKFKRPDVQTYKYEKPTPVPPPNNSKTCLEIAELLSKGSAIDKEAMLTDVMPKMRELKLGSSILAAAMGMLLTPAKELRMKKLGMIMSALFPEVRNAVVSSYNETRDENEWTISAENALKSIVQTEVNTRTERHIVQAIITDYLCNELNKVEVWREWAKKWGM